MKTYKVTVPYWYTLSAIITANSEAEALEAFDEVNGPDCMEEYYGRLEGCTPEETIEEIKEDLTK